MFKGSPVAVVTTWPAAKGLRGYQYFDNALEE